MNHQLLYKQYQIILKQNIYISTTIVFFVIIHSLNSYNKIYTQFIKNNINYMSFRDTFTRNSAGSNQNLQYDDNAFYHFISTVFILMILPLIYSVSKSFLFPHSNIRGLKQAEKNPFLQSKIKKYKQDNKRAYLTKGFVFKIFLIALLAYLIYSSLRKLKESQSTLKGFDPYEILQIDIDTPIEKIKKAYRKLALKYHPDRNDNDPQAAAKFIMISKAYQCLTNDKVKQNCMKFGNPQGSNTFNVGIALPAILVQKEYQVKVMAFMFIILIILVPSILIYWNSQMNKYDQQGMLIKNHITLYQLLNQNLSIRDVPGVVGACLEFQQRKTTKTQIIPLQSLFKQVDEDISKTILKKNYHNWVKKTIVIIDSHINERKIGAELEQDYLFILKTVPKLINAIVIFSLNFSTIDFKIYKRPEKFMGLNPIQSLIWFMQFFIQGRNQESPNYLQLDLTADQQQKLIKKRKNKVNIKSLIEDNAELQKFLGLFEQSRRKIIKENIFMFPQINVQTIIETPGQTIITDKDMLQVKIKVTRKNLNDFAIATRYAYLKHQRWYIMICINKALLFFEKFEFDKEEKQFVYNHRLLEKAGSHQWKLYLMPDCYYGFDLQIPLKFNVVKYTQAHRNFKMHPQDQNLDQSESFISKMMSSMIPQEQQELSDDEEEAQTNTVEQQKGSEKVKQK